MAKYLLINDDLYIGTTEDENVVDAGKSAGVLIINLDDKTVWNYVDQKYEELPTAIVSEVPHEEKAHLVASFYE